MQCADTSKRDSGDVVVTNTCAFKIIVEASTPGGTRSLGNLDPGGSDSIATSAHNPWRVFSCTWPGTPVDPAIGKGVTYNTVKYECDVQTASPQAEVSPSQGEDEIKTEETKFYASAHPYMDEPLPELKKMVHELGGLKPMSSPEPLPDLLAKVAAKADELLHKVPDLISDEAVTQTQRPVSEGMVPGCVGTGCIAPPDRNSERDQKFNYIILTHPAPNGRLLLEEYRTRGSGKPVPQGAGAPSFQGFVSAWVIFSSLNQVESRFRQLGQQKTDGHNTFVIGFAQIPGSIELPGTILTGKGSVPMLLQGIAWVDQTDFHIVRLRTDLLAPQPQVDYKKQTSNIVFGSVPIASLDLVLWLPQSVDAEMEASGQYLQEQHRYFKYRLYQAKSKIILPPE
jgi:hypothetical protein